MSFGPWRNGSKRTLFALVLLLGASAPAAAREERLFHLSGDADSMFTLGMTSNRPGPALGLAFEVNDVVLKALPPDPRLLESDTRPRACGDYRALDATGRPYQLRIGARLRF